MSKNLTNSITNAALAALAVMSTPASADIVSAGGGDYTTVPLYRALAFGTVNFGDSSRNGAINGIDYVSNLAPLPLARGDTTITTNGATFVGRGASAYSGFYAGRNYASVSVTNANVADTYYEVAGQGSATSVRFFTPEAAAARARFTWHVSGSQSNPSLIGPVNCPTPDPQLDCFPPTTGRLDFGASTDGAVNWLNLFNDPDDQLQSITKFGTGTFSYDLPIVDLDTTINLFYWSSAYAQVNPGDAAAGSNFTLSADYFNTFLLENVKLYDADDNPISEWSMRDLNQDETVFNQSGRLAAVAPPPDLNAVPEPLSAWLVGTALLGLTTLRRRTARTRHG